MVVIASEPVAASLTILLFGPMQVLVNGRPIQPLRSRKALWLLALLTLRPGRSVERVWLAGALWPDTEQSRAFTNLRVNLSELRRALGNQSERLQSSSRQTLSLDLVGADVDTAAFDAAMKSKRPEALKQAVALYRGPLLEDCSEEWVGQERNVREQEYLQALQTLADAALVAGDHAAAIDYYRRAASIDPWREAARRGWMEALAKSGDRNAAMQVYREFVELLHSDPRAVPDEETSALYARLRAEARPRTSQQAIVTAAATVGNGAATPVVRGYLPHPLTDLIGREEECIEVATKLRKSRLVTLTGSGGIGKTRLAIEVARESAEDGAAYPDGVWLVSLESLLEARLVVPQVATVLGLREESGRTLLAILTDYLRLKRLLLVLDNCEHLMEECAQVSAHLLRECARVRILATSREALRITGEAAWQVPSLAAPDVAYLPSEQETLLRVVAKYESVQLFVQRAQASQKDFVLTEKNALAVAEVCSQLEGTPLAIELAATRVIAMTVEQIGARLHDCLGFLTGRNRMAQSRQQTLRATLDWSYALLSEPERLLLQRLSVFVGGWTLEAAEHVCVAIESEFHEIQSPNLEIENREVLNLLASLVDKSLALFDERETEGSGRYRLLEPVRQYAAEYLQASDEMQQLKARHRNWCLALAEEFEPSLDGGAEQAWAMRRLEAEHANLRAALAWIATEAQPAEVDLRLTGALWRYWSVRGHISEGRRFLEWALTREEASVPTQVRAKALYGAGALALAQSDYVAAQSLLEESLGICRQLEDKRGIAFATGGLGDIARNQGDLTAAKTQAEESLRLHRELKNKSGIAAMLIKLGELAYNEGELAAARSYFEESLGLHTELGNKLGMADVFFNLGNTATMQSDYVMARTQLEASLLLYRELGNKYGIAQVLSNLATTSSLQGDHAAAQAQREESLRLERELGDRRGVAYMLINLGVDATMQGDYMTARSQLEEALSLCRELRNKVGIACALVNLGDIDSREGDLAAARIRLEEGLSLCRELGDKRVIVYALIYLGRVVALQGDIVTARTRLEEGLRLCRELGDKRGIALTLENFAVALSAQTESAQAARLLGAAQALRKSIRSPLPPSEQEMVDRQIAQVRKVLGTAAFMEFWEEGSAMTSEQVVHYTLKG